MLEVRFNSDEPNTYVCSLRYSDPKLQHNRSIDQQRYEIQRAIQHKGYRWTCLREYADAGVSGKRSDRDEYNRMIRDIESGAIKPNIIITDTPDRLGGNDEAQFLRHRLKIHHGILVLSVSTGLIPNTGAVGEAVMLAEQYRSKAENRVKAHQVSRAKLDLVMRHLWPDGPIPTGFQAKQDSYTRGNRIIPQSTLEIRPDHAAVISRIFIEIAEGGVGTTVLASKLNEDPLVPAELKPFIHSRIITIVRNPIYMGTMLYPKVEKDLIADVNVSRKVSSDKQVVVENFCPAIVTKELWRRANDTITARSVQRTRRSTGATKEPEPLVAGVQLNYSLSGLVFCQACGTRMTAIASGRKSKSGTVYRYYHCSRARSGACANKAYVPLDELHEVVFRLMRTKLFPPPGGDGVPEWFPSFVQLVEAKLQEHQSRLPQSTELMQRQIDGLRKQKDGWALSLGNRELPASLRSELEQKYANADAQATELLRQLDDLRSLTATTRETLDQQRLVDELRRLDESLSTANPTLLNVELAKHVKGIYCSLDGKIILEGTHVGLFPALTLLTQDSAEVTAATTNVKQPPVHETLVPRKLSPRRVPVLTASNASWATGRAAAVVDHHLLPDAFVWRNEIIIHGRQPRSVQASASVKAFAAQHPEFTAGQISRALDLSKWIVKKSPQMTLL